MVGKTFLSLLLFAAGCGSSPHDSTEKASADNPNINFKIQAFKATYQYPNAFPPFYVFTVKYDRRSREAVLEKVPGASRSEEPNRQIYELGVEKALSIEKALDSLRTSEILGPKTFEGDEEGLYSDGLVMEMDLIGESDRISTRIISNDPKIPEGLRFLRFVSVNKDTFFEGKEK